MINTIASLFEIAGYKNYKEMDIDKLYPINKNIYIMASENNKPIRKRVTHLIYKGEAISGFKVISEKGIFLGTENHLIYNFEEKKYISLKEAFKYSKFIGLSKEGPIQIFVEEINEPFSILDISVDGEHNYFSGGILSHNSFGGGARSLSEFIRKINILCANYDTTFFLISQERVNMSPMAHLPSACVTPDTLVDIINL